MTNKKAHALRITHGHIITLYALGYTQHNLPWDSTPLKAGNFPSKTVLHLFGYSPNHRFDLRFRRRRLSLRFIGFRPPRKYSSQTRPLPHSKCEVCIDNSTTTFVCQQKTVKNFTKFSLFSGKPKNGVNMRKIRHHPFRGRPSRRGWICLFLITP